MDDVYRIYAFNWWVLVAVYAVGRNRMKEPTREQIEHKAIETLLNMSSTSRMTAWALNMAKKELILERMVREYNDEKIKD